MLIKGGWGAGRRKCQIKTKWFPAERRFYFNVESYLRQTERTLTKGFSQVESLKHFAACTGVLPDTPALVIDGTLVSMDLKCHACPSEDRSNWHILMQKQSFLFPGPHLHLLRSFIARPSLQFWRVFHYIEIHRPNGWLSGHLMAERGRCFSPCREGLLGASTF